jgi:hypothetical protein
MTTLTHDEVKYIHDTRTHLVLQARYGVQLLLDNILRADDFDVVNPKHLYIEANNIELSLKYLEGLINKHHAEVLASLTGSENVE